MLNIKFIFQCYTKLKSQYQKVFDLMLKKSIAHRVESKKIKTKRECCKTSTSRETIMISLFQSD